jgi:hypothetical protein
MKIYLLILYIIYVKIIGRMLLLLFGFIRGRSYSYIFLNETEKTKQFHVILLKKYWSVEPILLLFNFIYLL